MTTHLAPCGAEFDTAEDARSHELLCDQCAGATEPQACILPAGADADDCTTHDHDEPDRYTRYIVLTVTGPDSIDDDLHQLAGDLADVARHWKGYGYSVEAEDRDGREVIDAEFAQDWQDAADDGNGDPQTYPVPRAVTRDRDALDALAAALGTPPNWDGGADYLDTVANIVGSVRPHPGAYEDGYREVFKAETGRDLPAAFDRTDEFADEA